MSLEALRTFVGERSGFGPESPLLAELAAEVETVEQLLREQTASSVALVERAGRHTLEAGGKRLRPALVALAAQASGMRSDPVRRARLGGAMELIHMATLIHDDVIDGSALRRGQPTAHRVFGVTESILAGDVLLAKAMALLAEDDDEALVRMVSAAVTELVEGEVHELQLRGKFDVTAEEHLDVVRRKTAGFVRACCEAGAMLAKAPPAVVAALAGYGAAIGAAFQLVDDVLDYRGRPAETGKLQALDFRDGQATLPLIRLVHVVSEEELQFLRLKFGGNIGDDEVRMIVGWMETRGAFASVEAAAREAVATALDHLARLPETPARRTLETLAEYVVDRRA